MEGGSETKQRRKKVGKRSEWKEGKVERDSGFKKFFSNEKG